MTMESDSFVGKEVAGYRVEEVIGQGGMGVVYRAEHIRLGRKVALKVVAPQIAREPKFRDRFLRESRTAGTLDHPNVVPMYDAGEADGVLYIAMRFVDGVDLATLIAREVKLQPARAARIVAQVASALDAAHEAGLVHRDVKPSNVLLPERGAGRGEHAYLGDFGLTKRVLSESGVTGSSAFLGTIAYVAPEQIEGRAVDARADQYSLACLVYECLTGHKPFERETDIATLYAHIRDPFPSVGEAVGGDVASGIDAVLRRAAAKQPGDRYPSCGEMAEELLAVAGAVPGTGTAVPTVKPAVRRPSRRRLAFGFGSAVVVVALVVGGVLLWGQLQAPSALLPGAGVVSIDATTNQATAAASFTEEPTGIAADETAAWVAHFALDRVSRVDAVNGAVSSIEVGAGPAAIVAAEGYVYVLNASDETLNRIEAADPAGPSTQSLGFRPGNAAFGDGVLWVIDGRSDAIVKIATDPRPAVGDTVAVGAGPVAVAAGRGAAWIANDLGESLSRVDATLTGADTAIPLDFAPGPLVLDPDTDTLWIVDAGGDAVVRFDAVTRRQGARVMIGARPVGVAVGGGAAWVVDVDGVVSRIDPATNTVVASVRVGGAPVAIAAVGDTVWVAIASQ